MFSDIHIFQHKRSHTRLNDCIAALEWVFDTALSQNIKNIVFLGDLFHDRQKIDVLSYIKTYEVFERYLKNDIMVYLLTGNHDMFYHKRWDINSLIPLRAFKNVIVIDKPSTIQIDNFPLSFLPYTHDPITDLKKIRNNSKFKILLAHIAIHGARLNLTHDTKAEVFVEHDGDMVPVGAGEFIEWDQVFLGHYHAAQKISNNTEYIGSPLQLSYGEANDEKHIVVYDLQTKEKTYVKNTFSPLHYIIPLNEQEKYDLKGNFVKFIIDDLSAVDLVSLRNKMVTEVGVNEFEIKTTQKHEENKTAILDVQQSISKIEDLLERWTAIQFEQTKGLNLDKELALSIGKEILNIDLGNNQLPRP